MTVNRNREKVRRTRDTVDLEYDTLDAAIAQLEGYRKLYGGDAVINLIDRPYDDTEFLAVTIMEDETDKEMQHRIEQQERLLALRVQHERNEFERLKAKFGN